MSPETKVHPSENERNALRKKELRFLENVASRIPEGKVSLHWEYLPAPMRKELVERYHDPDIAKRVVNRYIRQRRFREKWPSGWWDSVDPEPLLDAWERAGKSVDPRDKNWLRRLCEKAKKTRQPPLLTSQDRIRLSAYGTPKQILERMGIPYFKRVEDLRDMITFWEGTEA